MSDTSTLPRLAIETLQAMSEAEFDSFMTQNRQTFCMTENGVDSGVVLVPAPIYDKIMEMSHG